MVMFIALIAFLKLNSSLNFKLLPVILIIPIKIQLQLFCIQAYQNMMESRSKMYEDNETELLSKLNDLDTINKNRFLISYDGFDVEEEITIIANDLKWLIQNLRRAKESGKNEETVQYEILERKLGRTCKRYKRLFEKWLQVEVPEELEGNLKYDSKKVKSQRMKKRIQYWEQPIQEMVEALRRPDPTDSELKQAMKKKKQSEKSQEDDLESIADNNSDLSWEYDAEPGPLDKNAHLQSLIQYISEQLYVYVYLPSQLKVTIVGINEIDQLNQRASVILKLELKIKVPQNAEDESDLFRHLAKLKIHAKSRKMKNQEENIGSFFKKPGEPEQQNSMFFGNSIENDQDAPFSIWTEFKEYYSLNKKFKDSSNEDLKKMLHKLKQFDGAIFSCYLKDVQVKINSYSFNAPFQVLDLNGFITIEEIQTKIDDWQDDIYQYINYDLSLSPRIVIKPNLITLDDDDPLFVQHVVNSGPEIEIDEYELAEKLIKIEILSEDKSKIKLKNGICGWRWADKNEEESQNRPIIAYPGDFIAYFHFPIYRHPFKALGGIFIPTVVLGIINLFIFYQDSTQDGLGDRIANIATLLISFVAMINVIQSQIKRQVLTVASILIHMMILTPLLCIIDTMYLFFNNLEEPKPLESVLFWICVIITGLNILYPVVVYLMFKIVWERDFNLDEIKETSILLPGDKNLDKFNDVPKKKYYPIKDLSSQSKIGIWQKNLSKFLKETLASSLENTHFRKKIKQLARMFPRFHHYLAGKEGKVYQDILLSKKRSKSLP